MTAWVTHLMIADRILKEEKGLDRRGFCVGNIAPDCNIENEDWTSQAVKKGGTKTNGLFPGRGRKGTEVLENKRR